jgi:hypothetical protein
LFSFADFSSSLVEFSFFGLIKNSNKGTNPNMKIAGKNVSQPLLLKETYTKKGMINTEKYFSAFII